MLPAVIRMNGSLHADWYAELLREVEPTVATAEAPEKLATMVTGWLRQAGLATTFNELAIPASGIEMIVEDALKQWTGTFNPVPLDAARTRGLYRSVA
jgi:alcohol dehydrogenase